MKGAQHEYPRTLTESVALVASDIVSLARKDGHPMEITGVRRISEGRYSFNITALMLAELGRVLFKKDDHKKWVNRDPRQSFVNALADRWIEGDFQQSQLILELPDTWAYERGKLTCDAAKPYVWVDDGLHRYLTAKELKGEGLPLDQWLFSVAAFQGSTLEARRKRALTTFERQNADPRWKLEMKWVLGEYATEFDRQAYAICVFLSEDDSSPLKGRILRDEVSGPLPIDLVNVVSLNAIVRRLVGGARPWKDLKEFEKKRDAIVALLKAAQDVWPKEWDNTEKFYLGRTKGVVGLLTLPTHASSKAAFASHVGQTFTFESFRDALRRSKRSGKKKKMVWSMPGDASVKLGSYKDIAVELDQAIA